MTHLRWPRRGSIFVTTIWVIVVTGALLLVFARPMRTELIASGNRLAAVQADAVEIGAEQYGLSLVGGTVGGLIQGSAEQTPCPAKAPRTSAKAKPDMSPSHKPRSTSKLAVRCRIQAASSTRRETRPLRSRD